MIEKYSDELLWIVIVGYLVAFVLAFGIGANDVANSFGTSVGSKVLTIRQACCLATVFEILGAVLIGYKVSNTVRNDIIDISKYKDGEKEVSLGFLSSLSGSALWLIAATFFKMPISGTHSIVGASVGFALVLRGFDGIQWKGLLAIVLSWFISPVLSGTVSVLLFVLIRKTILSSNNPMRNALRGLPLFYGCTVFVNIFSIVHEGPPMLHMDDIPLWLVIVISCGLGLVTGLFVQFFLGPRLKKQILADITPVTSQPETKVNFTCGDTDESSRESSPKKFRRTSMIIEDEKGMPTIKEPKDISLTAAGADLKFHNGKSKKLDEISRNGIYRQTDDLEPPAKNNGYLVAETNLSVNMNPNLEAVPPSSVPPSGQVTPSTGLSPNSSAVPLVRPKDVKQKNSPLKSGRGARLAGEATLSDRGMISSSEDLAKKADDPPEVGRLFSFLQVLTATFGSFAHGGNDVSNAIGPLISLWQIYVTGSIVSESAADIYILLYGGVGISIGLWLWGRRVIETIGEDLTKITPSTGFTIEIGAATTVLIASKIGLPVSTTHCKVGSVVFVGWASSSRNGVDWKLFRNIISAWLVTVPVAAALSAAFMAVFKAIFLTGD